MTDLYDQFLHATDEEVDEVCDGENVILMRAMIYARYARAESSAVLLEVAQAENARLRAACERAAKMNCAKGPRGKHYRDPVYCNDCVSCDARAALSECASKDPQ